MKQIKQFLIFLNGKKTIIGLIALNLLQIDGLFDTEQGWYKVAIYLCMLLSGGGLAHKAKKLKRKNG